MSHWFTKTIAAIIALLPASGLRAADARKSLPVLKAELQAQQLRGLQMRLLSGRWVYVAGLPLIEGSLDAKTLPRTTGEMFDLNARERVQMAMALETVRKEDVFSDGYRTKRLVLSIEGIAFDPDDSQYWFG